MKTKGLNDPRLSGEVDDNHYVAYYPEKGYAVVKKKPHRKANREISEKEKFSRLRFACINAFASRVLKTVIRPIWSKCYENGLNGWNLFLKKNKQIFNEKGELTYPRLLQVSVGCLPLPPEFDIVFSRDDNSVIISWIDDFRLEEKRANDRLYYAFLNEESTIDLFATDVVRRENEALIYLEYPHEKGDFVYVFFVSPKRRLYSNSECLELK